MFTVSLTLKADFPKEKAAEIKYVGAVAFDKNKGLGTFHYSSSPPISIRNIVLHQTVLPKKQKLLVHFLFACNLY